jgi:argininosuccinate lyase
VFGHLFALLTVVKGVPLTFNKDFQEDKEALFDTVDTMLAVLDVYPPMIRTARFNRERLAAAAVADFSLATDIADLLAKHNVPFREAHEVVGRLVRQCLDRGITFAELTDDEWRAAHPLFAKIRPPLTAEASVAARDVAGGTAPDRVREARLAAATAVASARDWLAEHESAHEAVMRRPGNGVA